MSKIGDEIIALEEQYGDEFQEVFDDFEFIKHIERFKELK